MFQNMACRVSLKRIKASVLAATVQDVLAIRSFETAWQVLTSSRQCLTSCLESKRASLDIRSPLVRIANLYSETGLYMYQEHG